jgi:hypothetical protein
MSGHPVVAYFTVPYAIGLIRLADWLRRSSVSLLDFEWTRRVRSDSTEHLARENHDEQAL